MLLLLELKMKYILILLNEQIICCDIIFKVVQLIIFISVWFMLLNKYGLQN
jgi:uncharacterized protein HemY